LVRPEATITTLQFVKGAIWEITQCDVVDPAMTYGTLVLVNNARSCCRFLLQTNSHNNRKHYFIQRFDLYYFIQCFGLYYFIQRFG